MKTDISQWLMEWVDIGKSPEIGDTVKVSLNLPDEVVVGVVVRYAANGKVVLDIGSCRLHISSMATFLVKKSGAQHPTLQSIVFFTHKPIIQCTNQF